MCSTNNYDNMTALILTRILKDIEYLWDFLVYSKKKRNTVESFLIVPQAHDGVATYHWAHGGVATLKQRQWRWFNVATTSCAPWRRTNTAQRHRQSCMCTVNCTTPIWTHHIVIFNFVLMGVSPTICANMYIIKTQWQYCTANYSSAKSIYSNNILRKRPDENQMTNWQKWPTCLINCFLFDTKQFISNFQNTHSIV